MKLILVQQELMITSKTQAKQEQFQLKAYKVLDYESLLQRFLRIIVITGRRNKPI
jgi:hypothetical protein